MVHVKEVKFLIYSLPLGAPLFFLNTIFKVPLQINFWVKNHVSVVEIILLYFREQANCEYVKTTVEQK